MSENPSTPVIVDATRTAYTFQIRGHNDAGEPLDGQITIWPTATTVYVSRPGRSNVVDSDSFATLHRRHGDRDVTRNDDQVTDDQAAAAAAVLAAFDAHPNASQLKEDARRWWVEDTFAKVAAFEDRLDRQLASITAIRGHLDELRAKADPTLDQPVPTLDDLYQMPGYHSI